MKLGNKKFLITGITSIHGWPIFVFFQEHYGKNVLGVKNNFAKIPKGENVVSANIEDREALKEIFDKFNPDCVIHCAGLCDLDVAEAHPEYAYDLNVNGARYLFELSQDKKMVYLSYDLVYSGKENDGSGYREEQIPDPITVVGKSIVAAEQVLQKLSSSLIIRLALPLGPSIQGYKGAVDWIDSRFRKGRIATLLYDEVRSTINTEDIGPAVSKLMQMDCSGIYNLASPSIYSIFGIGEQLIRAKKYPRELLEGRTRAQFPPSPPRMGNVTLNSKKSWDILGWIPKTWSLVNEKENK